jgi:hypothetical protein
MGERESEKACKQCELKEWVHGVLLFLFLTKTVLPNDKAIIELDTVRIQGPIV